MSDKGSNGLILYLNSGSAFHGRVRARARVHVHVRDSH
jgi:hypothetical protein